MLGRLAKDEGDLKYWKKYGKLQGIETIAQLQDAIAVEEVKIANFEED